MLAFKVGLSLDMKRLSRMSKSASELAVERILKSEGEIWCLVVWIANKFYILLCLVWKSFAAWALNLDHLTLIPS